MSDKEGDSAEKRDDEVEEYVTPISALPPKVISQEENQVEVSSSPAFQCLDELFQSGRLTGTKVSLLKAKYTELHDMLKSTRGNELELLQNAKSYTIQLEDQNKELDIADAFPEGNQNSEVSKMRTQLLVYNNEIAQCDDRQYELEYKVEGMKEERKMIEKEYQRMPKADEAQKKIEELKFTCQEMRREITQRQQEKKLLKEDFESNMKQLYKEGKELESLKLEMESYKSTLVSINATPHQAAKEADRFTRQKNDAEKKTKEINAILSEIMAEFKDLKKKQDKLDAEKFDLDRDVDRQSSKLGDRESEYQILMKDFEYAKEREAVLMGDRATLDLNLRHIILEKRTTHDVHSRKSREKDRKIRDLKKGELQLRMAQESVQHIQQILEKLRITSLGAPKNDGTQMKKRETLHKEVEDIRRSVAVQNSLTAVETVKVEQSIAEEERLLYEQSDLRIEVVELTRLAAIKNDEREQKARDFMRAEMRYHRAVQDLKTKQLQIQDHQKKFNEMQLKLKEFAKLYDIIKNERNKCVNQIQTSTQKAAEMREKIKILQNEIEILRTAVFQKDRQLQKQRLKHSNSTVIRDSLRNEVAKQHRIDEEMNAKREQQRMDIAKLNLLINQAEEQMVKLRKKYETAVQNRNDRGIQLIEREEEVCVFYERLNIQEQMVRNGNVELKTREEEIRFLDMQLLEDKRSIDLLRKTLPSKRAYEQELVTLQIQLSQCQDRMLELERDLENPQNPERVRFLEGNDLKPADLHLKMEELEVRLAEKEESLLEKDLIFEQVTRLGDRVSNKAEAGKEDTLNLAKEVNGFQAKIKASTRKQMATVSELSMHQANALKLQQEVKEREGELEQCYMRMEKGEAPSEFIEREWIRSIREEERRRQDFEHERLANEEEEQYTLPGGIVTTAEPRPNAYIPDDDADLPIPRPYGRHAPYKPNEPGATMRHIRKPVPKPIEI